MVSGLGGGGTRGSDNGTHVVRFTTQAKGATFKGLTRPCTTPLDLKQEMNEGKPARIWLLRPISMEVGVALGGNLSREKHGEAGTGSKEDTPERVGLMCCFPALVHACVDGLKSEL